MAGTREAPAGHVGTLEPEVYVPAARALLLGLAWGLVVSIVVGGIVVALRGPWYVAPLAGMATVAGVNAAYLTRDFEFRRELQWAIEEITRRDLNKDGQIGKPVTVRVELERQVESGRQMQFLDLDVEPDKVRTFAQSVLAGRSLAVAEWTGTGGLFSRGQFERLRGDLLERGLVRWVGKGKGQGVMLTPAGKRVFERLVHLPPTDSENVV